MIATVFTHNLDIYLTGLLREIYISYIDHAYSGSDECIFYGDDLPMYSYKTVREFMLVWEILRGIGLGVEQK